MSASVPCFVAIASHIMVCIVVWFVVHVYAWVDMEHVSDKTDVTYYWKALFNLINQPRCVRIVLISHAWRKRVIDIDNSNRAMTRVSPPRTMPRKFMYARKIWKGVFYTPIPFSAHTHTHTHARVNITLLHNRNNLPGTREISLNFVAPNPSRIPLGFRATSRIRTLSRKIGSWDSLASRRMINIWSFEIGPTKAARSRGRVNPFAAWAWRGTENP